MKKLIFTALTICAGPALIKAGKIEFMNDVKGHKVEVMAASTVTNEKPIKQTIESGKHPEINVPFDEGNIYIKVIDAKGKIVNQLQVGDYTGKVYKISAWDQNGYINFFVANHQD